MATKRFLLALSILIALPLLEAPLAAAGGAGPGRESPAPDHMPPVEAPVVDPFRPPAHVGGAGNRGLEYSTAPGTPARASKAGQVSFAGQVAGSLYVTVAHLDGIRTSYSYLASIAVTEGQFVEQGEVLGLTEGTFHFGARRDGLYVDPAQLFGTLHRRARLVPVSSQLPTVRPPAAGRHGRDTLRPAWMSEAPAGRDGTGGWQAPMRRVADLAVHFRTS